MSDEGPQVCSDFRAAAIEVIVDLRKAGYVAYLAGGCVRDRLLGLEPKDYDIATSAHPNDLRRLFRRVQFVGEAFGVGLVRRNGFVIELATFRSDGVYEDGRHPTSVEFTDAEHDARRRDFTMNGLFEDPVDGRVIDFVGGQEDLAAQRLRAIGDPTARFVEDHLRMLRAVRFAARFDFEIEAATQASIRQESGALDGVSAERVGEEIRRMMLHPSRGRAGLLIQELTLDHSIFGEPKQESTLARLTTLPPEGTSVSLSLAAWMLDRVVPDDCDVYELAEMMSILKHWACRLVLSNDEQKSIAAMVECLSSITASWDSMSVASKKRLASSRGFDDAIQLMKAAGDSRLGSVRSCVSELAATGLSPRSFLNGTDVVGLGIEAGPRVGALLDRLYDEQLEGSISTREEALALLRSWISHEL